MREMEEAEQEFLSRIRWRYEEGALCDGSAAPGGLEHETASAPRTRARRPLESITQAGYVERPIRPQFLRSRRDGAQRGGPRRARATRR